MGYYNYYTIDLWKKGVAPEQESSGIKKKVVDWVD